MAQHDQPTIHIRLPRPLHDQLREAAEREGLSLNTLVVSLLAGGIGFKLAKPKQRARAARTAEPVPTSQKGPDEQHAST
jgi:hypothetical protein